MKKHWRCHVCNDIHYGFAPPEICPTCRMKNAYVEISSVETRKVMTAETQIDKSSFIQAIERFADKNEFQINPDVEKVKMLLEGIFNNEYNHGLKFCPCRLTTHDFEEDLKLICPCNFLIHESYKDKEDGECWCGLFIRRKK
jgi:ferredoxin-thioredoxin reductase catalytic chain